MINGHSHVTIKVQCNYPIGNCLCKQSLNQASQEDREGLSELLFQTWSNLSPQSNVIPHLTEAILKEYVLVRREK